MRLISLLTPSCAPSPTSPNQSRNGPRDPEHLAQVEWAKKERLKGEEIAEVGVGWGEVGVSCLQSLPPLLMMLSFSPTNPANLKPSLARSKKKETKKSLLLHHIPLVLHYGTIQRSLKVEGGWEWLYPESCHYTAPQLTKTSTFHLTTPRFYKVNLTHLSLLYLFSCNWIFKHVPLKQKESELRPCKCPPMISLIFSAGTCPRKMTWEKNSCRVQECSDGGPLQTLGLVLVSSSKSSLRRALRAVMRALISSLLWRWTVYSWPDGVRNPIFVVRSLRGAEGWGRQVSLYDDRGAL